MINVDVVLEYIRLLTGSMETAVTWQTFDDSKKKRRNLARILHGRADEHIEELARLSAGGAGVFITVNETDGRGREAKNVVGLRALFVDKDDGPLPDIIVPPPTFRVMRKGHGEHAYWVLREGEDKRRFRSAQKQLITHFGTDPAVHDLPRVMRVPGFPHQKDGIAEVILLAPPERRIYSMDEVLAAFPANGRRGAERLVARLTELQNIAPGEVAHDTLLAATTELAALEREGQLGPDWPRALRDVVCHLWAEPMDAEKLDELVASAREKSKTGELVGLVQGEKGALTTAGNASIVFDLHPIWEGSLAWNAFTEKVTWMRPVEGMDVKEGDELQDHHLSTMQQSLARILHKKFSKDDVILGAQATAHKHTFHPVQEYLFALEWDGVKRLDTWLSYYGGAEADEYTSKVGRWFLISAVARVMDPGCKVDHMLLLIGKQRAMKSTLAAVLGGHGWFRDGITDVREKQAELDLAGYWIVEVAELDAFSRAEQTSIKAFLTRRVSQVRPPYGRVTVERPRQCVFIGTTNNEEPLNDPTGGRRFWPVKVDTTADRVAELMKDRDQLWAEAAAAWARGEAWWPAQEDHETLEVQQEASYHADTWEDVIRDWWEGLCKGPRKVTVLSANQPSPPFTSAEILEHALRIEPARQDRSAQTRLGYVMRRLGWYKIRPTADAARRWTHPSVPTFQRLNKVGTEN